MPEMDSDLKVLDDASLRELNAYRRLGTLKELRCLKHQESRRRERNQYAHRVVNNLLGGVTFAAAIYLIVFIMIILS